MPFSALLLAEDPVLSVDLDQAVQFREVVSLLHLLDGSSHLEISQGDLWEPRPLEMKIDCCQVRQMVTDLSFSSFW